MSGKRGDPDEAEGWPLAVAGRAGVKSARTRGDFLRFCKTPAANKSYFLG